MSSEEFRRNYPACRDLLRQRIAEPAPGRIQLLTGPRQVGKTTLLLDLARTLANRASYVAADGPEARVPGFWERLWTVAEATAAQRGLAVVLLDEAHLLPDWAARLKGQWDRMRRRGLPVHVVATGSSSLRLASGSRESLAGRFERITLTHWDAAAIASTFNISADRAIDLVVEQGAYPGAFAYRNDPARWAAYVRDAIVEPAIGRDILALAAVRRPALLRQVFGVCVSAPAQIVSLQKIQGLMQDAGALETIAHYLALLQEAHLIAALGKHSMRATRQRAAPPKLIALSNAFLAATQPVPAAKFGADRARLSQLVQNACLAHAWNAGQSVTYWREEPIDVDGVIEGSWGSWAVEVKLGEVQTSDLRGLLEFCRRNPSHRPLVLCDASAVARLADLGVQGQPWREFLWSGPPGALGNERTPRGVRGKARANGSRPRATSNPRRPRQLPGSRKKGAAR